MIDKVSTFEAIEKIGKEIRLGENGLVLIKHEVGRKWVMSRRLSTGALTHYISRHQSLYTAVRAFLREEDKLNKEKGKY